MPIYIAIKILSFHLMRIYHVRSPVYHQFYTQGNPIRLFPCFSGI
jgi:hypothetical protein